MSVEHISYFSLLLLVVWLQFGNGLFIKSDKGKEWEIIRRTMGLSDQKVKLLQSQKDQRATIGLLNQYMRENPKYMNTPTKKRNSNFAKIYEYITRLESKGSLKTSLHFEISDKPFRDLKRTRRKIAIKMISDIPSDQIDELLYLFGKKHGINADSVEEESLEEPDLVPVSAETSSDYMYENLYEDEEDVPIPAKTYGSFQDLILRAGRKRLQQEITA